MKASRYPQILGFERLPEGKLLSQLVDFSGQIGTAYERCIGYVKDFHSHEEGNLAFPRGSSIISFQTRKPNQAYRVDDSTFFWMPPHLAHFQTTVSTVYDNLALFPKKEAMRKACSSLRLSRESISSRLSSGPVKVRRSKYLDELLQRFFFARVVSGDTGAEAQELSERILLESVSLITGETSQKSSVSASQFEDTVVSRAIQFLETNLFSQLDTRNIAAYSRVSPATLFRKFHSELGMTPFEYVRTRRLEEAKHLLETGDYQVSDVAALVGYEDLSAFSKAFKRKFSHNPRRSLGI